MRNPWSRCPYCTTKVNPKIYHCVTCGWCFVAYEGTPIFTRIARHVLIPALPSNKIVEPEEGEGEPFGAGVSWLWLLGPTSFVFPAACWHDVAYDKTTGPTREIDATFREIGLSWLEKGAESRLDWMIGYPEIDTFFLIAKAWGLKR